MSSRSRSTRGYCALVPRVERPGQDLATPTNQHVTIRMADRLRQRARRQGASEANEQGDPPVFPFPWNDGCRRFQKDAAYRPPASTANGRLGCALCKAGNSRNCICGAELVSTLVLDELASAVRFVRSPGVPVYDDEDPEDQRAFVRQFETIGADWAAGPTSGTVASLRNAFLRAAVLGAISGRPDVLSYAPFAAPWLKHR